MELRNARGRAVDPVPFLVVCFSGFTVSYSYGPGYLMAIGLSLREALGVSTLGFLGISLLAYYRYVWIHRPDLAEEIPATARIRRLLYAALIGVALLALLALPLIVRYR